jgi:hypothetical protein
MAKTSDIRFLASLERKDRIFKQFAQFMDTRSKDGEHQKAIIANCDLITTRGAAGGAFAGRRCHCLKICPGGQVSKTVETTGRSRSPPPLLLNYFSYFCPTPSTTISRNDDAYLSPIFLASRCSFESYHALALSMLSKRKIPTRLGAGSLPALHVALLLGDAGPRRAQRRARQRLQHAPTHCCCDRYLRCRSAASAPRPAPARVGAASDQVSAFSGNCDFSSATNKA